MQVSDMISFLVILFLISVENVISLLLTIFVLAITSLAKLKVVLFPPLFLGYILFI